jgi:hypothetical protein
MTSFNTFLQTRASWSQVTEYKDISTTQNNKTVTITTALAFRSDSPEKAAQ